MTWRLLALVVAIAALCVPGVTASGADFQAATATPGNAFTSAADFNTVAVSMADPGTNLHGVVALSSTAASDRGIAKVRIQAAPAGTTTWTDLCTLTSAPYSCNWDSSTLASATYDLRALALDAAGYTRATATFAARVVDNTGPTVTLTDPGVLSGVKTISATASDAGAGVATLSLEYRRPGAPTWTQLCTGAGTSRSCALNTTAMTEGSLELRAVAVDTVGNARSSVPVTRLIDNTLPVVSATQPDPVVHGTSGITATASDSGSGIKSVRVEIRLKGTTPWQAACVLTSPPYTCTGDTHALPDGIYEVRAVATDNGGLETVAPTSESRVDNTAPTAAALVDPGGVLSGSVAVSGTASDAGSGIASWRLEYATAGTTNWKPGCTSTSAPFGCSWDTTTTADGNYDLRVVATDLGTNTKASATRAGVRVDNDGPTVTFAGPAVVLRGSVPLSATATDPAGVGSIVFERSSGGAWTTICTATVAPYGCSWDTTAAPDGYYTVRARGIDGLGHERSVAVAGRQVDNTAPNPADVQTGNGGATPGRIEAGDWISFAWTEAINPSTLLSGFTGASKPVSVRVTDAGANDTLEVLDATAAAPTGIASAVALGADLVTATATWDATMAQAGSTVTVTLGALRGGTPATGAAATMGWTASGSATDLAGNPANAMQVLESGAVDLDF